MNILFTICGRAGSKGLKNKNLRELNGIPLVYYSLFVIKLYCDKYRNDKVVVALNTDSEELVELVMKQTYIPGIQIIKRKAELADDTTPKVSVIQSTYQQCKSYINFDVIVDLDVTSPLRRLCDVECAIQKILQDRQCDVAFSVVPSRRSPYFNMVEKRGNYYQKICRTDFTVRQQSPATYELNASIYAYNPNFLEKEIDKTLLEYNCAIIEMPDYLVLDIDSEKDLWLMKEILPVMIKYDKELGEVIRSMSCNV